MILRVTSIALICQLFVCLPYLVVAQSQNIPGRILGLSNAIPEFLLPMANNDSLRLIDSLQGNAGPSRIAIINNVEINFKNQAERQVTASGERVYRLRLNSPNAYGLTLLFNEFYVAVGAQLFIYGADTTVIFGPYSDSHGGNGTFSTPPIPGNSVVIELKEPANPEIPSSLELFGVGHVYAQSGLSLGASSPCNNDVNCTEGSPWLDQKRAVVRLLMTYFDNSSAVQYWGSGVMLNNSELDGDLYLLTAYHNFDFNEDCFLTDDERSWANLLNVTFNYESDYCNGPLGSNTNFVSGAQLVAYSWESDFALLRLLQSPSPTANVFLAGWDSRDITPLSGVGIHHPLGDLKKISVENETLISAGWYALIPNTTDPHCQNTPSHHWQVQWNHFAGDHNGITQGGSSGSPFFNHEGRVVGQLHGGNTNPENCFGYGQTNGVPNMGFSLYGKLSSSWYSGGAIPLAYFLDPIGNTEYLDGVYLNTIYQPPTNGGSGSPGSQTSPTGCQWGDGERFCTSFNEHIELIDRHWDDESGLKRAYNAITAEDVTIVNESSVRFEAMNTITLKAPFSVDASRFTAILGDCECHCPAPLFFDDIFCEYDDDGYYVPGGRYANPDTIGTLNPTLYPNPTTGLITLQAPEAVATVQVLELTGRVLQTLAANGSTTVSIDLSPYHPGTYLLRAVYASGKAEVWRVVRQ